MRIRDAGKLRIQNETLAGEISRAQREKSEAREELMRAQLNADMQARSAEEVRA